MYNKSIILNFAFGIIPYLIPAQKKCKYSEFEREQFIASCQEPAKQENFLHIDEKCYCECMFGKVVEKYPDKRDFAKVSNDKQKLLTELKTEINECVAAKTKEVW